MCICTGFRPSGYIQKGDKAVFISPNTRHIPITVKFVDKITGLSVVDSGYGTFTVPTNSLRRIPRNE